MTTVWKAAALMAALASGGVAFAQEGSHGAAAVQGRWDAVLSRNGVDIPFRLDIKGEGAGLQGVFFDGWTAYDSTTSAKFENNQLTLNVDHYLTTISAKLDGGKLAGSVVAQNRETTADYVFSATRHVEASQAANAPSIAGTYIIPLDTPSSKGENAFRFIAHQQGAEVAATILRIDGDTGSYSGTFKDGKWRLSHYDGSRPGVIVVTPKPDGTLDIQQQVERPGLAVETAASNEYGRGATPDGRYAPTLVAYREDVAKAKGLPEPSDALTYTTARDPNEIFKFSFPNLDGKLVSSEDFKGKVVVAIVTGTWCPNCHDEAQYLVELDRKYRDKGLAIVALTFEEPAQHDDLERARAFVKQYGVEYTYLLAGAPAEMWEKVPQLNQLTTWPATVFVGRDGKIKAVHAGFASPASGEFHAQLRREFTARIEQLLSEKAPEQAAITPAQAGAARLR